MRGVNFALKRIARYMRFAGNYAKQLTARFFDKKTIKKFSVYG
jgi:hypothetical protein